MEKFTDQNFMDILNSGESFVLDFGAAWCGPCKKLEPILEQLEEEYRDIPFYKCDVGENQHAASHFSIFSVPTIILFKDGKEVSRISGLRPKEFFEDELKKIG